jgi:hypothetical protein
MKTDNPSQKLKGIFFYSGVFLITAATLILQIVETRIISVIAWYHLAFFVISVAMFGLTAGSLFVYFKGPKINHRTVGYYLTNAAIGFAIATALSLVVQLSLALGEVKSLTSALVLLELGACLAVPFFFSGVVVSLALTRSPYPVGTVYGVDLIGAAAGSLAVLLLLNLADGPTVVLATAVIGAVAAFLFSMAGMDEEATGRERQAPWYKSPGFLVLVLLAATVLNGSSPYGLRPAVMKSTFAEKLPNTDFEQWNSFSRVAAYQSSSGYPFMWGRSANYRSADRIEQRLLNIDGMAGTPMYRFGGNLQSMNFLRYDITNLAHFLDGHETGAVIGVGGGRDVLSQRVFGVGNVTAVELNPIFIKLLKDEAEFVAYSGINNLDGVELIVDEARSWFARTEKRFDVIQMSMIDTWAATGAGAMTLSENGLYTIEAWQTFMSRLNSGGVFTVSRWYAPGNISETGRMISLAMATLHRMGVANPKDHIFVASNVNIATLILTKDPLEESEIAKLHRIAEGYAYKPLVSPRTGTASKTLDAIVNAPDLAALNRITSNLVLDLTPPTDDRPFFFNQLRMDQPLKAFSMMFELPEGVVAGNLSASVTMLSIIVLSFLAVVFAIIIPLRPAIRSGGRTLVYSGTAYFLLIGIGFMMAEIGLLQRMSVFLGHPVYSLSIVLFSLILATGLGSLLSERLSLSSHARLAAWCVLAGSYILTLPFWLPTAFSALDGASLPIRAGLCIAVLAPGGLLMGFGFPTGMRLVSALDTGPTPWFWGINGAAGVLAASAAVVISITFSIDATLAISGLCYLGLLPFALVLLKEGTGKAAVSVDNS